MSPIYVPGKVTLRQTWQPMDPDAAAYITAVETTDGQALEEKVKIAIDNFVLGCKADGIWGAIKASCILAGARTLSGALVPLVGAEPTKNGTEGGWNYNRKTGLQGNGTDNYIDSGRSYTADPQNNFHLSVLVSTAHQSSETVGMYIGGQGTDSNHCNDIYRFGSDLYFRNRSTNASIGTGAGAQTGFLGSSRSASASFTRRYNSVNAAISENSVALSTSQDLFVFARNLNGTPNALSSGRLAFYSIGESLDLARLDARVTDLINAFGVAIP